MNKCPGLQFEYHDGIVEVIGGFESVWREQYM